MIEQTAEEVAEAMRDNPEDWAEMFIELQQRNQELERMMGEGLHDVIPIRH